MSKPFQRIVFLIRDWQNSYKYDYGSEGGKCFLNETLTIREGMPRELADRRRNLDDCFSKKDCFLMPRPGKKFVHNNDGNHLFDGRPSGLIHNSSFFGCLYNKLPIGIFIRTIII